MNTNLTLWIEISETEQCTALSVCGDYVISHRINQFVVSYRPLGKHIPVGTAKTLEKAKQIATHHANENNR